MQASRTNSSGRLLIAALLGVLGSAPTVQAAERFTIRLDLNGEDIEGTPLKWSDQRVYLLSRDGRLWEFAPGEVKNFRRVSSSFRGYSANEMRAELEREFGDRLVVTGTGHFLIAHPRKRGERWAERFEELYRSFLHYCQVRGLRARDPKFPLVAIVWPNQADFFRYAQQQGDSIGPGVLGYYSPTTNRIVMYDTGAGKTDDETWDRNVSIIAHEAAHQSAFNTGIHGRFASTPRWLAEGLGTLFEARGVYDSYHYDGTDERVNDDRLTQFKKLRANGRPAGYFVELVSSDRQFARSPLAAYAEAWAFTFFLTETMPSKYNAYLAKTARRPAFVEYSSKERMADFTAVFGNDLRRLDADFLRFIDSLD